jgi:hypothetical protein
MPADPMCIPATFLIRVNSQNSLVGARYAWRTGQVEELDPTPAIREHRRSMSRTPKRYDAEEVRRFSDTTIAYYDRFARAFWNGTRDQNYAAFLDAIGSPSGFPGDAIAREPL